MFLLRLNYHSPPGARKALRAKKESLLNGNRPDFGYLAARRQLNGMACSRYEVGVLSPDGKMMSRNGDAAAVLNLIPWLKKQNHDGCNIYIRPTTDGEKEMNVGLILVDDLSSSRLDEIKKDLFIPSAVVETSPGNFQAWIRLSATQITPELATACARYLADKFQGDRNSADWKHFGRFSGFTNRKPKYCDSSGRFPFVLCKSAAYHVCQPGRDLIRAMDIKLKQSQSCAKNEISNSDSGFKNPGSSKNIFEAAQEISSSVMKRFSSVDLSRVDFSVAKELVLRGYNDQAIAEALRQSSQDLSSRKTGHVDDYLLRTVKNARLATANQLL